MSSIVMFSMKHSVIVCGAPDELVDERLVRPLSIVLHHLSQGISNGHSREAFLASVGPSSRLATTSSEER